MLNTETKSDITIVTKCLPLFFTHIDGSCRLYDTIVVNNRISTKYEIKNTMFYCRSGHVINDFLVNDLIPDCESNSDDEFFLKKLLLDNIKKNLCKYHEIPCVDGHFKCYNFSHMCNYHLDGLNHLTPCRTGTHLHNCSLYECNKKFKCISSYCILWSYVCDGKWDCPEGDDEANFCNRKQFCINMYKCKQTHICIHLGNICDNVEDCPYKDDEMHCDLKNNICPKVCDCLYLAISCNNLVISDMDLDLHSLLSLKSFILIHLDNTKGSVIQTINQISKHVQNIKVHRSNVIDVCQIRYQLYIACLDFSFNLIHTIKSHCLAQLFDLKILILHHNKISSLEIYSFSNLKNVRVIDISKNPITYIISHSFKNLHNIKLINFRNILFNYINVDSFINTNPKIVFTTSFGISCFLTENTISSCHPPQIASCLGILPTNLIKTFFAFNSLSIVCLSCLSSILYLNNKQLSKTFIKTALGIDFHHCICGLYFSVVWIYDKLIGEIFINDEIWRSHFLCFLASGLLLCFEIINQLLLLLLSISRLMIVIFPLDSRFKNSSFTTTWMFATGLFSVILPVFLLSWYKIKWIMLPSNLCLIFGNPTNPIIYYITWFLIISKITTLVTISAIDLQVYKVSVKSNPSCSSKMTKMIRSTFFQLILTGVCNFISWLPICIIYTVIMLDMSVSPWLLMWATVALIPLNAFLYPIIFIYFRLKPQVCH